GQLSVQPSGQFTFTPALNFNGTVSFVYQACDGQGLCDQGTFTLSVLPVNDIPVVLGETRVMNEDAILNSSVAGNDSDAEPGPLTYSLLQGPASGILVLQSNGSFTYTPVLHFSGWVSFTYQACDAGGLCGSATASVQVVWINDLPVAGDDMFMLTEDQPFTASVAGNDLDVDIEPLLFSTLMAPSQGLLSMEQTVVFTYTPSANFNGFVSFLYLACDTCNACDAGLVSLLIQPVNDAPLPLPDSFTGNEDTMLSGSVAINDNDIEGDQLTYTLFSAPAVGILNLGISGSFMYTPPAHFHG
ncbi:MAG: Ig-like domain-containing protein, partial [Bacteroidota bacterium]